MKSWKFSIIRMSKLSYITLGHENRCYTLIIAKYGYNWVAKLKSDTWQKQYSISETTSMWAASSINRIEIDSIKAVSMRPKFRRWKVIALLKQPDKRDWLLPSGEVNCVGSKYNAFTNTASRYAVVESKCKVWAQRGVSVYLISSVSLKFW